MAGHSQFSNRKHKKEAQDSKRGKAFTKLSQQITIAAKQGGPDIATNSSLRVAVSNAKDANMPKDKIAKAIAKSEGTAGGYIDVKYEFYGPGGVAVLALCSTDNKNRTAAEVKAALNKYDIPLAAEGSAGYIFPNATSGVEVEPTFKVDLSQEDKDRLNAILSDLEELDDLDTILHNA
jgi:YebC/PmpR family DNA-binding regulatory protein